MTDRPIGPSPRRAPGAHPARRGGPVRIALLLLALVTAVMPAAAQDDFDDSKLLKKANRVAFGLSSSHGNQDAFALSLGLDLLHRWQRFQNLLDLDAAFLRNTEDDDEPEIIERIHLTDTARRGLSEGRWHLSGHLETERDLAIGLDDRLTSGLGAGISLAHAKRHLAFDAGLAHTWERPTDSPRDEFLAAWIQQILIFPLAEAVTLHQRFQGHQNLDDTDDWRVRLTVDLLFSITERLGVQMTVEVKHDEQPIDDFDETDAATTMHVTVSL